MCIFMNDITSHIFILVPNQLWISINSYLNRRKLLLLMNRLIHECLSLSKYHPHIPLVFSSGLTYVSTTYHSVTLPRTEFIVLNLIFLSQPGVISHVLPDILSKTPYKSVKPINSHLTYGAGKFYAWIMIVNLLSNESRSMCAGEFFFCFFFKSNPIILPFNSVFHIVAIIVVEFIYF